MLYDIEMFVLVLEHIMISLDEISFIEIREKIQRLFDIKIYSVISLNLRILK